MISRLVSACAARDLVTWMASKDAPDSRDRALGSNIQATRYARNISQCSLAARSGLSLSRIKTYEQGLNRIGATHLVAIALALECRVCDLVKGGVGETSRPQCREPAEGALELLGVFSAILAPHGRTVLIDFARRLAAEEKA